MTIRVLIADDHALMREGLRALLETAEDIRVVGEAGTGYQVQKDLPELKPDVVLMDITMPDLNGIEAARAIQATCPNVRTVILTMHATSEYVYRAFDAGALGYVLKESASEEVIAAVRAAHAGKRYLSKTLSGSLSLGLSPETFQSPLGSLSIRERQVLQMVAEGRTSGEIAGILHLSPKSVDTYRSRLMAKLGVRDIAGLVKFAIEHGLTSAQ